MRRSTSSSTRLVRLLVAVACAVGGLAACSDQQPLGESRERTPRSPHRVLQAFDCTAIVGAGVSCRPASGGGGGASADVLGGSAVQFLSSNLSYDAGTEIYQFDVQVLNPLNEAIGTADGVVADPDGIRVFFSSGPAVTFGSGDVSVANPDGTATITAPDQPYYAYPEILASNDTSAAKTWQFIVPSTVGAFTFQVLVETDVQYLLVINEVLVNPGLAILDLNGEWFEVYNAGTLSVDLQGLVVSDSAPSGRRPYNLITASVPVAPGGYVVLGNNADTTLNGGVVLDYAYGSVMALTNSLDALKISRVYGADTLTIDRTAYASAAISAQNGISRELKNPSLNNANMDGSNWAAASVSSVYGAGGRGTPGAQNSAYVP